MKKEKILNGIICKYMWCFTRCQIIRIVFSFLTNCCREKNILKCCTYYIYELQFSIDWEQWYIFIGSLVKVNLPASVHVLGTTSSIFSTKCNNRGISNHYLSCFSDIWRLSHSVLKIPRGIPVREKEGRKLIQRECPWCF